LVHVRDPQGRAQLKLADLNTGTPQSIQAFARILEFDCRMADVVTHTEMPPEGLFSHCPGKPGTLAKARHRRTRVEVVFEKPNRFRDGLKQATWFRFERQCHGPAGLLRKSRKVYRLVDQVVHDASDASVRPRLERSGN